MVCGSAIWYGAGNLLACRSHGRSAFQGGPHANRLIPAGLLFEGALLAVLVYSPPGNALFATAPMGGGEWLRAVLFAALFLLIEEVRKLGVRHYRRAV